MLNHNPQRASADVGVPSRPPILRKISQAVKVRRAWPLPARLAEVRDRPLVPHHLALHECVEDVTIEAEQPREERP